MCFSVGSYEIQRKGQHLLPLDSGIKLFEKYTRMLQLKEAKFFFAVGNQHILGLSVMGKHHFMVFSSNS